MSKITLALVVLLSCCVAARAQEADAAAPAANPQTQLRQDLDALALEAGEIDRPLARASALTEVAGALWPLDEARAKGLLREALELTFPDGPDRARLRERAIGDPIHAPTPEESARTSLRARVLRAAARDGDFERELIETTAREAGREAEVLNLSAAASDAAKAGRLEEAARYTRRMMESEPTLANVGWAINEIAVRDRAEADRLILVYLERLRALPLSVFERSQHSSLRLSFVLPQVFLPGAAAWPGASGASIPPVGRAAVRAYLNFVVETLNRLEQARAGSSAGGRALLMSAWPLVSEHAPELAGHFAQLERMSRPPGQAPAEPPSRAGMQEYGERSYRERLKTARQTKDPLALEMAVSAARARGDFAEARKLLDLLADGALKTQLNEAVNADEVLHLIERGDTAGAEKVARQINAPGAILRAYPPLIKRLVKDKDSSSAAFLAGEAVRRLKRAEEEKTDDTAYVPSALAGLVRPPKGSRLPRAVGDIAAAVAEDDAALGFDLLTEFVRLANKHDAFTENGDPGFDPSAFRALASRDESRARQLAEGLGDRLQKIVALTAVYRRKTDALAAQAETPRRP